MWRPRPSVRQYPSRIATTEPCQMFMKYGMGLYFKKVVSRREFSESRLSNRHISLKGPNKFLSDLVKFDTGDLPTMP